MSSIKQTPVIILILWILKKKKNSKKQLYTQIKKHIYAKSFNKKKLKLTTLHLYPNITNLDNNYAFLLRYTYLKKNAGRLVK